MLQSLLDAGRTLLVQPSCPLCQKPDDGLNGDLPCLSCRTRLNIQGRGLSGDHPLPWIALGHYERDFRQLLLRFRSHPSHRGMQSLIQILGVALSDQNDIELVPIPSWKRHQLANPWPQKICDGLGRPNRPLLRRCRSSAGQHHLNRHQRFRNLLGAFRAEPVRVTSHPIPRLWMVDDILTTGATALAAMKALTEAGHRVAGLVCLARTPEHRR